MVTLYRARWLFPVSDAPIADGAVAIAAGRIRDAGTFGALVARYPSARQCDLGTQALLPAAINAHTHLNLTGLSDAIPAGLPFAEWILALTRARAAADRARDVDAVADGVAQVRASATAAVGDITTNPVSVGPLIVSGLRGTVYYELLGGDPAQAEELFQRGQRQIARWRDEYPGARLRFGLSLHAPYTVSAPLFRLVSRWCAEHGVPLCVHAAESPAETEWLRDRGGPIARILFAGLGLPTDLEPPAGCSPIAYLARLGVLDARPLLAHGVQVTQEDLALLAQAQVAVAHCPRSNAALGCGRLPLAVYRAAGVRVALGTDSRASAPSLSLWAEAAAALANHRAAGEAPTLNALLRMATLDGAEALGVADELGSISSGKAAELACVSLDVLHERERDSADAVLDALFSARVAAHPLHG